MGPGAVRYDGLWPDSGLPGRTVPDQNPLHIHVAAIPSGQWLVRRPAAGYRYIFDYVVRAEDRRWGSRDTVAIWHGLHLHLAGLPHRRGADHSLCRQSVPQGKHEPRPFGGIVRYRSVYGSASAGAWALIAFACN